MEGQNENDELYPIAVLIDELKVLGSARRFSSHNNGRPSIDPLRYLAR